ncbi:hypothetical protein ACLOJK_031697 [Asimina triloba]
MDTLPELHPDCSWGDQPIWATDAGLLGVCRLPALQRQHDGLLDSSQFHMMAYSTPLNSMNPDIPLGTLNFAISNITGEYVNDEMIIFADIMLLGGNTTTNQVCQEGSVTSDVPPFILPQVF